MPAWWRWEGANGAGARPLRTSRSKPVLVLAVVILMIASGFASITLFMGPLTTAAKSGGTPTVVTLGNQERQDISAPNQWAEGNLDFWLESHYFDTEVRFDAGSNPAVVPDAVDFSLSFYFSNKNAVSIDWAQDWYVTMDQQTMFWTKTTAPAGANYTCPTPSNIVAIPVGGRAIEMPVNGSRCIDVVMSHTTGNVSTGWFGLGALSLADLNSVLPYRNAPCTSVSSSTGLCVAGTETEAAPAGQHFFEINFEALFGAGGLAPQSWWPNLPAGSSLALYFRNHLAMTAVWDTNAFGSGGGSQPQFCSETPIGALLNTVDRCDWTSVSRFGAGYASGSSTHGDVIAPGIGEKTIPLPNVVAPAGFLTVCKIVTTSATDYTGALGTLANNWTMNVQGPFQTNETRITGETSTGCVRFGPLYPDPSYMVTETPKSDYVNIGTVVSPAADRASSSGSNPNPSNPVGVELTFSEASDGTGPTVTFVNLIPVLGLDETCDLTIADINGAPVTRTYALVGDTITHNYTVTNTGNVALNVTQNHTNTAVFGPNPLFQGVLDPDASHSTYRSVLVNSSMVGAINDSCYAIGVSAGGTTVYGPGANCSITVRAPHLSFTKYPTAADNVTALAGDTVTYRITVTNSGDAPAVANVSDALGAGQIFLNGGAWTTLTGASLPSMTPSSPGPGDWDAPVTIEWDGLEIASGSTIYLNFTVLVTATSQGAELTGLMTLTGWNGNGVDYSPTPNTASNLVTVLAPNVTFEKHPVASDHAEAAPGTCVQFVISVSNSGDASAIVNVSDALAAGQTLLNGGGLGAVCGEAPSPTPTTPTSGADYAAPVTITWDGVVLNPGQSLDFTFWIYVTAAVAGFQLTGTMTLTATNTNGIDYTPDPNTARNLVTVVRPILKLSEFGYTNSPNGTPTSGVVNGTTVYTVVFTNYGTNASVLSGSLSVGVTGAGSGSLACWASTGPATLSASGISWTDVVLAPGQHVTFTLTVSYSNMSSGAVISAELTASYTPLGGGTSFVPSGTPAMISFTVRGD